MNRKKGKKIVAAFLLLALAVEMAGYHFVSGKEKLIVNDILADGREATVEGMKNPLDTVEYLMDAVQQKDADKFIRGCAVTEQAYGADYENLLKEKSQGVELYAPSGDWLYYFPLMQAVLTQQALKIYQDYAADFQDHNLQFVGSHYSGEQKKTEDGWRAAGVCMVELLFKDPSDVMYSCEAEILEYDGQWKMKVSEMPDITEAISKEDTEEILSEADKNFEETHGIEEREDLDEKMLLPANYFCYKETKERTPEELVREWLYTLKRGELEKALTYFTGESTTLEEYLEKKGEYAEQLKKLLFDVLEVRLDDSLSAQEQMAMMDPQNIVYLRGYIREQAEREDGRLEVQVELRMNGQKSEAVLFLKKSENGWGITEIRV